jgi:hypothetical protein
MDGIVAKELESLKVHLEAIHNKSVDDAEAYDLLIRAIEMLRVMLDVYKVPVDKPSMFDKFKP